MPAPVRTTRSPASPAAPSLRTERALLRQGMTLVAGMDEVGRGALAGPVSVGVVIVGEATRPAPAGLRDSKLLTPAAREHLVEPVRRWCLAYGVGHAEAAEIDAFGSMTGLRLAGRRALAAAGQVPDIVVLDGSHDWLTDPARAGLFAEVAAPDPGDLAAPVPPVMTVVKGDRSCSSVAAASVLAKVERDAIMTRRHEEFPAYGWAVNKGYAAPSHRAALAARGACREHRRSWNLGGGSSAGPEQEGAAVGRSAGGKSR